MLGNLGYSKVMCEIRPLIAGRLDLHCHGDLKVG